MKKTERDCLEKTRAYLPFATREKKEIINFLIGETEDSERPDFLIRNDYGCIGVEHFLVDTLLSRKKDSRTRSRTSDIDRIYNKFHDSIESNEIDALKEVEKIIQSDINAVQFFNYQLFITEFNRILDDHARKAAEYRSIHADISTLIFLIEIPVAKNRMIGVNQEKQIVEIKGERFPITIEMLKSLKKISNKVDFFVLTIIHEDYKNRPFVVYAFDSEKFEESVADQIKDLYYYFTYDWQFHKTKAKVELKFEDNGDNI